MEPFARPFRRRPPRRPVSLAVRLAVLAWAGALAAGGCGDANDPATPPPPDDPAAGTAYLPAGDAVPVERGAWRDFRVAPPRGSLLKVRWERPGREPAVGERYRFFGTDLGAEQLLARIEDEQGRTWNRSWTVTVVPAGRPRVEFLPAAAAVTAWATVPTVFSLSTPWPLAHVAWTVDGAPASGDTVLQLLPDAAGARTVAVEAALADTVFARAWTVDVRPFAEAAPPAVTGLAAAPGGTAGYVILSWDPVTDSALPVEEYEVRWSAAAPPDAASWPTDPDPGSYGWSGTQNRPTVQYAPEASGLAPGQEVWFAVRARNDRGQLSPLGAAVALRLPEEWWLEGTITAPDGTALADVPVRDHDRLHETVTAADGGYRLGPYYELDRVVIEAGTGPDAPAGEGWHLARTDSLDADGGRRRDFILLPRLGSVAECFNFGSHFQAYLRTMTRTRLPTDRRPNLILYRWPEYPIPVHVPDWVSPLGVDYGECARTAVAIWNESMGEPYFTLVDDPAAARVEFRYDLANDINYGVVELDQPGDGDFVIGELPPEHASVRITPESRLATPVTEIALHELGHVLGLVGHSYCNRVPYLMNVSAFGALADGPENAIHPDERHAVAIIRQLPPVWDMAVYPVNDP